MNAIKKITVLAWILSCCILCCGILSAAGATGRFAKAAAIFDETNTELAGDLFKNMIRQNAVPGNGASASQCGDFVRRTLDMVSEVGGESAEGARFLFASIAEAASMAAISNKGANVRNIKLGYIAKFIRDADDTTIRNFLMIYATNGSVIRAAGKDNEVARMIDALSNHYPDEDLKGVIDMLGDIHEADIPGVGYVTRASARASEGGVNKIYAGLLSFLKSDNKNSLKGFLNELKCVHAIREAGFEVLEMSRKFETAKGGLSDIDIICRDASGRVFVVQCKVSNERVSKDMSGFLGKLSKQLSGLAADHGPLQAGDDVVELFAKKVRFAVPNEGKLTDPVEVKAQMESIGRTIVNSLSRNGDDKAKKVVVDKIRGVLGGGAGSSPQELSAETVGKLFMDVRYDLGLAS